MGQQPVSCDIFCAVVDNFGDIGVCWRLARQLAGEYGVVVRLWVDDLGSFHRLCAEVDPAGDTQNRRGVEVRHWTSAFPTVQPAQLVIEAFACELPKCYVQAMAAMQRKPVWLNLEYLSAEDWVEGCHALPSPHPQLPLVKHFFFPGFTSRTGGLLLERDLLATRDVFQADEAAQAAFWRSVGVPPKQPGESRISLFCYENDAILPLLESWAGGSESVTCLVPEGRALPQVAASLGRSSLSAGETVQRGALRVQVLPFVEQERYDLMLWGCDCNFVRGEDSFVRAQWAGRPFVWHIYPQHDGVHEQKLHAFLALFEAGLSPTTAGAVRHLWDAWNGVAGAPPVSDSWNQFRQAQSMLAEYGQGWARHLAVNNLALNLLDFFREVGRIRAFEI